MDLYYAGAEQPGYLATLYELGVRKVAISYYEWQGRYSNDDLYNHMPKDVQVCITAGISRKEGLDYQSFANDYMEFCEHHAEGSLIYGLDAPLCPRGILTAVRHELGVLPNVVVFPLQDEELRSLALEYERIGINARVSKSNPSNELRRIAATLYGSNITDPRTLKPARFVATTTMTWLSANRYGELWLFIQGRLRHYKADMLTRAVRAHRAHIEALGVDPELCLANNKEALTEVAVISLRQMEQSLTGRPRDRENVEIVTGSTIAAGINDKDRASFTHITPSPITPKILNRREPTPLPLISVTEQDGVRRVTSNSASVRQCNSCNLSEVCPGYMAESTCAYNVPVEIKTREQWEAASQVLLEAQFQRTMHGAFVEQTDGGDLTPRVGQEMDRFFKILHAIKDLEQTESDGEEDGPLTRFFRAIPQRTGSTNDETEDTNIVEGEVIEGEEEYLSARFTDYEENTTSEDRAQARQ